MRNRPFSGMNQHQLVLSLTPECLQLLHLQRGVLGWRRAHEEHCPLPQGDDFLAALQQQAQQCTQQWRLPPGTRAHWVLASDILGIIAPAQPATAGAALLPFAPSDTRTQADVFAGADNPGMLWIHKDWLAEIERISELCGLQLVELYARAQLFQREAARASGALKVVIEEPAGQQQAFLHIYAANGAMLRSRVLDVHDKGQALQGCVAAELAALGAAAGGAAGQAPALLLTATAPQPPWPELPQWRALKRQAEADRLWQLWRGDQEGIVVRATHEEVGKTLKGLSLALGLAGAVGLGAMVWHDGRLQQQIEDDSASARREAPRVAAAQALKARTLRMADAVQASQTLQDAPDAMAGLAALLARFPAPPATLLYVRTDADTLAFAAQGDEASAQALRERPPAGYGPLTDLPLPEFLSEAAPTIHLQTRRLPPEPQASSTPARESGT